MSPIHAALLAESTGSRRSPVTDPGWSRPSAPSFPGPHGPLSPESHPRPATTTPARSSLSPVATPFYPSGDGGMQLHWKDATLPTVRPPRSHTATCSCAPLPHACGRCCRVGCGRRPAPYLGPRLPGSPCWIATPTQGGGRTRWLPPGRVSRPATVAPWSPSEAVGPVPSPPRSVIIRREANPEPAVDADGWTKARGPRSCRRHC
jgi:hypothetical protein